MRDSPHICLASLAYPASTGGSGVATQTRLLAQALARAGYTVSAIGLREPGTPSVEMDGDVSVYRLSRGHVHWYVSRIPVIGPRLAPAVRELEDGWRLFRLVKKIHGSRAIDVVEVTETGCAVLAYAFTDVPQVLRLHGERFTIELHTPGPVFSPGVRLTRRIQRLAIRRAQVLVAPSSAHALQVSRELGSAQRAIQVIPNMVEDANESRQERPEQGQREAPVVLFAGRLEVGKGVLTLLEAAPAIFRSFPHVHIVIVGEQHPALPSTLFQSSLRVAQRAGHVTLRGRVRSEELSGLYASASVCVVPSFYESFGLALWEPILAGVPVVASDIEVFREFSRSDVPITTFEPGNSQALAEAVNGVLSDLSAATHAAVECRQMARGLFAADRVMPANQAIYRSLLGADDAGESGVQHVFLSPHADDVAWSCGGYIGRLTRARAPVTVVTVFGRQEAYQSASAFARHLMRKWGTSDEGERRREDKLAMRDLGVTEWESWDIPDAPFRTHGNGMPAYASYQELRGPLSDADAWICDEINGRLAEIVRKNRSVRFYVPLSIGGHVDHQIVYRLGLNLVHEGHDVRFYEDWPYVENSSMSRPSAMWVREQMPIDLNQKMLAATRYRSQLPGVGGGPESLRNRLRSWHRANGKPPPSESFWRLISPPASDSVPLPRTEDLPSAERFGGLVRSFQWHDLPEILPPGAGLCVDVGCGTGRHRQVIERAGYQWMGLDREQRTGDEPFLHGDAGSLPLDSGSVAAVVLWQVLEYLRDPPSALREAARVLEPGGIVCGSVSFLEPVHGRTWYGIHPLALEEELRAAGLVDIQVIPGLNGFSLMAWTMARRSLGERAARVVPGVVAGMLVPLLGFQYALSALHRWTGRGTGHGATWVSVRFPLEFAGHLQFVARKPARTE